MEYQVGSLADLISGNKTPNKTKVVRKSFTPIKKEIDEVPQAEPPSIKDKTRKKIKIKFLKKNEASDADKSPKKVMKNKKEKRKLDSSINDFADSDNDQTTPKKIKLSENEQNAAGRIKNKINKEVKNSSDYKDRTLFVGNIPINTKKEKVKKYFRKYGEIDSVRIRGIPVADPKTSKRVAAIKKEFHPDRNTIYAFIRFKNAEDVKKAEIENGELFENHHLRVHHCESEEKPDESKAIFVGNLAFNAEEEELWKLFKPCGPISHVRIVRDGRTGMGKGFGYINFKDADSVQLALEMEKVMLKDRELRISLCDSSRAKKKKAPKKPRMRTRKPKTENEGDEALKKKKTFKVAKMNPEKFSGSMFDEKNKKKKMSKAALEKKKMAKKLVASKPNVLQMKGQS